MNDSPPASRAWATADLIAVTSAIIFPTFVTYIYFTLLATAATIVQYAAYGFLKTTQFGMPVIWVRLVFPQRSLPRHGSGRRFRHPGGRGNVVPL